MMHGQKNIKLPSAYVPPSGLETKFYTRTKQAQL